MQKRGSDPGRANLAAESPERRGNSSDQSQPTPVVTPEPSPEQRVVYLDGPDVITSLQVHNGQHEYVLPLQDEFTLGASSRCDIQIAGSGLSKEHLKFERRGERLRVRDLGSSYGTFLAAHRVSEAEYLHPGDIITPVPLSLLAMNNVMRRHRVTMSDILGSRFKQTADELMVEAVKGSAHLLFLGDWGCDSERLARAVHEVSPRRMDELIPISHVPDDPAEYHGILERARRGTLLIVVPTEKPRSQRDSERSSPRSRRVVPLPTAFCERAFSSDYRIRVITLATSATAARRVLPDEIVDQMSKVWLNPIALRIPELPELLDRLLTERNAPFRFEDLSAENRGALLANEWRDNFIGLRTAADRLIAIARVTGWRDMNWRERADATEIPKSTLNDWYLAAKLSDPLFA